MSVYNRCHAFGQPDPDPDPSTPPPTKRRCTAKTPAALHEELHGPGPSAPAMVTVHHVWIDVSRFDPRAPVLPSKLSDMAMTCLRSWSGHPQVVWIYSAIEPLAIPGLTFKSLAAFMPVGMAAFMLAGNIPVQLLKDIMSMHILHSHGGIFADMDIMWLGRAVQLDGHGYLFPEEPHGRRTGAFLGRSNVYPNLAMFAMPKGSGLAISLANGWEDHWLAHAHAVLNGIKPAVDTWESSQNWMWNTRSLQVRLAKVPQLFLAYRPPIMFCPLSKNLTLETFDTLEQMAEHAPCLANDLAADYVQPSMATIAKHSVCINLWHRQRTDSLLQEKVIAHCAGIRLQNLGLSDITTTINQVDAAITASVEQVLVVLGKPVGHTVIGFVYAMFESPWLKQILGPTVVDVDGAHGFPWGCIGRGPWVGPPISASHWCGTLLYIALTMLCSPDHERLSKPDGSNPRAVATPCAGPAVDAALDFAGSMDNGAWLGVTNPVQAMVPWLMSHYNHHCDYTWPSA